MVFKPHQTPTCIVCGTELASADAVVQKQNEFYVCRNFDCQRLMQQKATTDPAIFKPQLAFQQQRIRERNEKQARRQQHIAHIEQVEAAENLALLDATLAQMQEPSLAQQHVHLLPLPSGLNQLAPLHAQRIERYRAHLQTVIEQAQAYTSEAEVPRDQHYDAHASLIRQDEYLAQRPALSRFSDSLCAQCRGGCCATGADHGFISSIGIRRLLDAQPELTSDAVLALYLDRVPVNAVEGSCINQTSTGCALPRGLRSDVCNTYLCASVKAFHNAWDAPDRPQRVLMVQRANHEWNRFDAESANPVVAVKWLDPAPGSTQS